MKLSLQLKLGQQLTMTPQLQQAIRLLQLSTLDLQQEIHEALEANPMLELDESSDDDDHTFTDASEAHTEKPTVDTDVRVDDQASVNGDDSNWRDDVSGDYSVESSWDEG
ncbi:MAG: RNA polymerase factor sigma-54, partial [Pseudomonadales bacterium]